ncbi:hypothetical protein E2C01_020754 [Portunus trituberculatus]|uniref:Uncharacterized protein n=1 Tax=Portunus trituberculatus TaxID=210409 RepID=A0A5B7E0S0_PORTR|nr:hypothetical protein [Portunus trituberculatus]
MLQNMKVKDKEQAHIYVVITSQHNSHLLCCSDGLLADIGGADRTQHRPPVGVPLQSKSTRSSPAGRCIPLEPPMGRHSVLLVLIYVHGGHYCSTLTSDHPLPFLKTLRHLHAPGEVAVTGKERFYTHHMGNFSGRSGAEGTGEEQLTYCRRHGLKRPIRGAPPP